MRHEINRKKREINSDLMRFVVFYNLYRRHGSLRKELNVKTPFDAIEKWYEIKPEKPLQFKNKILNLAKIKQETKQQPCET